VNLHHLKVFYEVANTLSFTKAADGLYITQPAVTHVIKTLEGHYDVKLFERSSKRVSLTNAGQDLYGVAEKIFHLADQLDEMLVEHRDLERGMIRADATSTFADYYFPDIYERFHRTYPRIDVVCNTGNTSRIIEYTLNGQNDFAFVASVPSDERLAHVDFLKDRLVAVVARTHPLARTRSILARDLQGQEMVLRERGSSPRRMLDGFFAERNIAPNIIMESGSTRSIKQAVASGSGISILSHTAVRSYIETGLLHELEIRDADLFYTFYLIYRKEKFLSRKIRAFLDIGGEVASGFER
jgi:LysR family transcriptional regulator, transcriptional activator of the cysJI operon